MTGLSPEIARAHAQLLASLGADGVRLGSGGEATVYTRDDHEVVRVFRADPGPEGAELAGIYRRWAGSSPDADARAFQLPTVVDDGFTHGLHWQILHRIPGTEVGKLLTHVPPTRRDDLLAAYLRGSTEVAAIDAAPRFGTLLGGHVFATWADCLRARLTVPSPVLRAHLATTVDGFDEVVARFDAGLDGLYDGPPRLVHVDYFPGNVMAVETDDGYRVSGVLDFASHSLFGDPLLDVVGAVLMADMLTDVTADERRRLATAAVELVGDRLAGVMELYRVFYALYYAMDDELVLWSSRQLTEVAAGQTLLG
jgi:aminoglycoside phosphotransferase (APT) family kinase protein